jgi:uncharacterized repeat protein (TIGR03803 family)
MGRNRSLGTMNAALMVGSIAILMLTPVMWAQSKYKTLRKFTGGKDGGVPQAGLIFDQAGNLYGTTFRDGAHNGGTVFELKPNTNGSWSETVLYSFCALDDCYDGSAPEAGLIFDQAGSLYGTTSYGGTGNNHGTVFKVTPHQDGSWTENVLYSFTLGRDGGYPDAGLVFDSSGDLYGTASAGGVYGAGVVFKLARRSGGSWTEDVLYDFTGGDTGEYPYAGVIFDASGNLYGTTVGGGMDNVGIVFKLSPSKRGVWTISVLHSFTGGRDGGYPYGSLVMDPAGNVYGTTYYGGIHEDGTVFKLTQSAGKWRETVLHSFSDGRDGALPYGSVVFDSSGNLYGMTSIGGDFSRCAGAGCGVVFKLAPTSEGGWKETGLHDFFNDPGAFPMAALIFDTTGNLYGTTQGDGTATFGSVFEITP